MTTFALFEDIWVSLATVFRLFQKQGGIGYTLLLHRLRNLTRQTDPFFRFDPATGLTFLGPGDRPAMAA